MKISHIFIDIDGVLNRFVTYILMRLGCNIEDDDRIFKPEWGWDIYKAYVYYHKQPLTENEFWDHITREMWATVPLTSEAWPIINLAVELVGEKNVCLLSAPPRGADQLAGKLEWIQNNMPKWLHRQYLFGPKKHYCARPDHLLIDDADHNCRDFVAVGGLAILVPRPWNKNHELPTLEFVTTKLDQLIQEQHD